MGGGGCPDAQAADHRRLPRGELAYPLAGAPPERRTAADRDHESRIGGQHPERGEVQVVMMQMGDQHRAQPVAEPGHQRHDPLQVHHAPAQQRIGEHGLATEHDPDGGVTTPDDVIADRRIGEERSAGHACV